MATEALAFHLIGMREDGQPIPPAASDLPEKSQRAVRKLLGRRRKSA